MKYRRFRIPFARSRSFRAMVERAFAEAFASLEPRPESRERAPRKRSPKRKTAPAGGWALWEKQPSGDSLV
jgi:hypothetical protein